MFVFFSNTLGWAVWFASKRGRAIASCLSITLILLRSVSLGDHHPAVDRFLRDDAFAGAVEFVVQRNVAYRRLEFLQSGIAHRVVFQMCHNEFAAALLGSHSRQDGLDLRH